MNFFKPEDFDFKKYFNWKYEDIEIDLAKACNQKLEREAIVVYGKHNSWGEYGFHTNKDLKFLDGSLSDKKALLINIEPIEKCKHESTIMEYAVSGKLPPPFFKCINCGAKVKPTAFESIND